MIRYEMYVARDKDGLLYMYEEKPLRMHGKEWNIESGAASSLDVMLFPEITWESEPKKVTIIEGKVIGNEETVKKTSQLEADRKNKVINDKIKDLSYKSQQEQARKRMFFHELMNEQYEKAYDVLDRIHIDKMEIRSKMNRYVGETDIDEQAELLDLKQELRQICHNEQCVKHELYKEVADLKQKRSEEIQKIVDYYNSEINLLKAQKL